jgi:periplasmic divalent cation tolerance protein
MFAAVGHLIVLTTVGNEEQANLLADELVVRRHAACVHIIKVGRTVYRWQGRVFDDNEYLLISKTTDEEYPRVEATIKELNKYELPEILAFQVQRGSADFLDWITANLDKKALFSDEIEPR